MRPLETLSNEHGLIRQFLDNLRLAQGKLEDGKNPPREFFEKVVPFAREFVDGFHHFKEEHVLFLQLAQKQQGAVDAQLDSLRYQHERGREFVTTIADSLDGYEKGDPIKTSRLIESVGALTALLRQHIHTEDHVFFPVAGETLSEGEIDAVQLEFDRQRDRSGGDAFEENHKLVIDMGSLLTHK